MPALKGQSRTKEPEPEPEKYPSCPECCEWHGTERVHGSHVCRSHWKFIPFQSHLECSTAVTFTCSWHFVSFSVRTAYLPLTITLPLRKFFFVGPQSFFPERLCIGKQTQKQFTGQEYLLLTPRTEKCSYFRKEILWGTNLFVTASDA